MKFAGMGAPAFSSITGDPLDNTALSQLIQGVSVMSHGATGSARLVPGVTVSGTTITGGAGAFGAADNGRLAYLTKSGGYNPTTARTITFVSDTELTLSGTDISTYTSGDIIIYSQDDADAIIATCAAAKMARANVIIPAGGYVVRKPCLVMNYATVTDAPSIIGAGAGMTKFFPAPDYDYNDLGFGDSILTDIYNCREITLSGFALYGGFADPGVAYKAVYVHSCYGRIHDVRITAFRGGAIAALYVSGSQMKLDRVHVEGNSGYGILIDGSTVDMSGCYHGNTQNLPGLRVYLSTVVQSGGTQDEAHGSNILVDGASSQYTLIGGRVEGLAEAYAVQVDAGTARFIGTRIHPFSPAYANAGAISVASGATVICCGCTLKSAGSLYGVLNAGTFIDGGGNLIEGAGISNSGVLKSEFAGSVVMELPASDPGVPGQIYHTAGAVMVSL